MVRLTLCLVIVFAFGLFVTGCQDSGGSMAAPEGSEMKESAVEAEEAMEDGPSEMRKDQRLKQAVAAGVEDAEESAAVEEMAEKVTEEAAEEVSMEESKEMREDQRLKQAIKSGAEAAPEE